VLDKLLVDAAVEAGAELREQFSVDALVWDGDGVTGIAGRSANGTSLTEHARIVIGADGIHSLVAREVSAPIYNERPTYSCAYYSYWSDVPVEGVEFYPRDRCGFGALPTHDGLTCIIAGLPNDQFPAYRANVEETFFTILGQAPVFAERVRLGKRQERFRGTGEMVNRFRKPFGNGWALVGDAGYHKDSITAQGITDAFRDAELLAEALDAGWAGRSPLQESMAEYEHRRNAAAFPQYDLACQFAMMEPPSPEMQQLFGALRANQPDTDRFVGTIAGTFPIAQYFAPDNMARIVGATAAGLPVGSRN
jgi:flavin-dependent dehydrogenase